MKFIKTYIIEHDLLAQHCISDATAEKASAAGNVSLSNEPFSGIPIISRSRSKWEFDKNGKIISLTNYKEDE